MKKIVASLAIMLMLVGGAFTIAETGFLAPVDAQVEAGSEKVVVVSGKGEVTVAPDVAYVTVSVETTDADPNAAQTENASKMDSVMKALEGQGISKDDIETTGYNMYETYDYSTSKPDGNYDRIYKVSNSVKVTVNNIDKVGTVIDATVEAGANNVSNIMFDVKDKDKYYNEALELAMADAKSKATAIMGTFGKTPGMPSRVVESGYSNYPSPAPVYMMDRAVENAPTPVEAGDITISTSLNVEYLY